MAQNPLVMNTLIALFKKEGWAAPETQLDSSTRLKEDLALDSFDLVQLILALNHTFQIELGSQLMTGEHLATLGSLVELLESQMHTAD
ncbi:hypothetical protein COW36_15220 [bacterium (Candidatus Blackallbacteria) CG17_big_fil_post_rev_8_21_14_2_50_48_46]|uniref:Carrier domain-containing protein n=1 Tax=bacterium (Candidatus Blackallbacteria) CG17_big_fil_post_rev_8_21_14_2_50_48_46 TaxID=2014261 RepID=A0A2M7G2R1_9BACT|nr:MAG: hypothetical protein COW64_11330 [bacterium (Candidatus Blackallbacteria) CG18_big_fil_WC_8_21_14_2_50_49_26]PIW16061.1 MAG: hypothetical protein COW36_15220 [bacterium (Candidatus Blackallbacteria) CG17_big_fil_post_rev_8_21_14_2_50_48_46]PIW50473.1 MAG: hypothetical protein COW20_02935 [bacterium (Candidatus Blackallbacteria) CG13_big_fil_rev_8_21_14_2_50_49_14]